MNYLRQTAVYRNADPTNGPEFALDRDIEANDDMSLDRWNCIGTLPLITLPEIDQTKRTRHRITECGDAWTTGSGRIQTTPWSEHARLAAAEIAARCWWRDGPAAKRGESRGDEASPGKLGEAIAELDRLNIMATHLSNPKIQGLKATVTGTSANGDPAGELQKTSGKELNELLATFIEQEHRYLVNWLMERRQAAAARVRALIEALAADPERIENCELHKDG